MTTHNFLHDLSIGIIKKRVQYCSCFASKANTHENYPKNPLSGYALHSVCAQLFFSFLEANLHPVGWYPASLTATLSGDRVGASGY